MLHIFRYRVCEMDVSGVGVASALRCEHSAASPQPSLMPWVLLFLSQDLKEADNELGKKWNSANLSWPPTMFQLPACSLWENVEDCLPYRYFWSTSGSWKDVGKVNHQHNLCINNDTRPPMINCHMNCTDNHCYRNSQEGERELSLGLL